MSGKYYVMADPDHGGTWAFSPQQLEQTLLGSWPQAQLGGPMGPAEAYDLTVPVDEDDDPVEVTYYPSQRFFAFADQDPLDARFRVIFTVLKTLSPAVPVVWTTGWDATPHRIDLSAGVDELVRPFEL